MFRYSWVGALDERRNLDPSPTLTAEDASGNAIDYIVAPAAIVNPDGRRRAVH